MNKIEYNFFFIRPSLSCVRAAIDRKLQNVNRARGAACVRMHHAQSVRSAHPHYYAASYYGTTEIL